jgi:LysM repeat protein
MAVITITTRPTPRRLPTRSPWRPTVAAGGFRVATRATYWRRRVAVAVLVVGLVLVMAQAGAALGGSSSTLVTPERRPAVASVVVQAGDSLWSIARRLAPGSDPRPVVDALAAARHGTELVPGETVEWGG